MKNDTCCCFTSAAAKVLSGIAIGNGAAIGMTILAYSRNPSLLEQFEEMLRTGLLINTIPFFTLLVIYCLCRCSRRCIHDNKYCD
ncbi:hypothetical protein [Vallitalea okinawensis]|uniref:hypothetical protein n=1 Tax=Vallitalea okinawensis TaxID=2078660 RepID=UPI000CFD73F8|nr:hypothetical protein [Vallitalea okinawensis]